LVAWGWLPLLLTKMRLLIMHLLLLLRCTALLPD
jgi:hypothetical protein